MLSDELFVEYLFHYMMYRHEFEDNYRVDSFIYIIEESRNVPDYDELGVGA